MCEDLKDRNIKMLNELLQQYNINKQSADLLNYESVFVSEEYFDKNAEKNIDNLKRVMLYANVKYEMINGVVRKTNKKEVLYSLGRKKIKALDQEEIDKTILELKLFTALTKQLKNINHIDFEESKVNDYIQALNF